MLLNTCINNGTQSQKAQTPSRLKCPPSDPRFQSGFLN